MIKTIRDLYEWARLNNAEDLPVGLKYQDSGGIYEGDTFLDSGSAMISVSRERVPSSERDEYILLS